MKLLLDENLSDRIVAQIVDLFPGSTHVKSEALTHTDDSLIADWAKQRSFAIVGLLRSHQELISEFISSETESVLVLERKRN